MMARILVLVLLCTAVAHAQDERNHLFIRDQGIAQFKPVASSDWTTLINTRFINSDNDVRTMGGSKAHLQFFITTQDVARVALMENVQLSVRRLDLDHNVRTVTLSQKNGKVWVDASVARGVRQHFSVETPSATIAVRGTRFYSNVADDGTTQAGCAEGHVAVTGAGKTVMLDPGFYTVVRPGQPPDPPRWDTQEFGPRPRRSAGGGGFTIDFGGIFLPGRGGPRYPGGYQGSPGGPRGGTSMPTGGGSPSTGPRGGGYPSGNSGGYPSGNSGGTTTTPSSRGSNPGTSQSPYPR